MLFFLSFLAVIIIFCPFCCTFHLSAILYIHIPSFLFASSLSLSLHRIAVVSSCPIVDPRDLGTKSVADCSSCAVTPKLIIVFNTIPLLATPTFISSQSTRILTARAPSRRKIKEVTPDLIHPSTLYNLQNGMTEKPTIYLPKTWSNETDLTQSIQDLLLRKYQLQFINSPYHLVLPTQPNVGIFVIKEQNLGEMLFGINNGSGESFDNFKNNEIKNNMMSTNDIVRFLNTGDSKSSENMSNDQNMSKLIVLLSKSQLCGQLFSQLQTICYSHTGTELRNGNNHIDAKEIFTTFLGVEKQSDQETENEEHHSNHNQSNPNRRHLVKHSPLDSTSVQWMQAEAKELVELIDGIVSKYKQNSTTEKAFERFEMVCSI